MILSPVELDKLDNLVGAMFDSQSDELFDFVENTLSLDEIKEANAKYKRELEIALGMEDLVQTAVDEYMVVLNRVADQVLLIGLKRAVGEMERLSEAGSA